MTTPTPIAASLSPRFDVQRARQDFPALHQEVHRRPLVYLDSAATALKPQAVIDAVEDVYAKDCANIHRAVHLLSQRATARYEAARETVRAFLRAEKTTEIVFTRGTTESINLVAQSYGRAVLREGDEVLVTELEHHSNIVPWQLLCQQTGAKLVVVPMTDRGGGARARLRREARGPNEDRGDVPRVERAWYRAAGREAHRASACPGRGRPARRRRRRCPTSTWMCGPSAAISMRSADTRSTARLASGVLYAKEALLAEMPPYQGGGDMILSVSFEETTYNDLPYKFEAGTPNIAGAIGLGAAIDYFRSFDGEALHAHEQAVLQYATEALGSLPGIRLVGTAPHKVAALSFLMEGAHPHDIGTIVDSEGVAIRTGHHCAQPVMEHFGVAATARASLGLYNTTEDIDALVQALRKVEELFR